jgi:hypothetical protein
MQRNGGAIALTTACLLMAGCAAKTLPPSAAILEARQRAVVADSRAKCGELGPVLDLPFVFGATDLTDDAKLRLDKAVAWAACTPRPQIAITVDPEYHHRQPDKDRAMLAGRQAVLRDYLATRLAAGVLLAEGASADPARTLLKVRGRGW